MINQIGGETIDTDTFNSIIHPVESDGSIVVLDFSASWCGPCKLMYPYLEKISRALQELNVPVSLYKVDVSDPDDEYCDTFRIQSLPTLLFMKDGKEILRTTGFQRDGSSLITAFTTICDSCNTDVDLGDVVRSFFVEPDQVELST